MTDIYKTWIYHETEEPKVINSDEYAKYNKDGWQDSPACFIDHADIGLDAEKIKNEDEAETIRATQVFEQVEGIIDCLNGELNLELMSKKELEAYAIKHLDIDLDKRRSKKRLMSEIRELLV
jgi:aminoglycoside N3'-acetyltransferase